MLAHPFTSDNPEALIADLKSAGLMGLEVYYGSYTPEQIQALLGFATRYNLFQQEAATSMDWIMSRTSVGNRGSPPGISSTAGGTGTEVNLIAGILFASGGGLSVRLYPYGLSGRQVALRSDIRQYGSGSAGASNVISNFSKRIGILMAIFDFGKGTLMVFIARLLGMDIVQQAAIGIAVIIGHNWPVFLRFNAGRGSSYHHRHCFLFITYGYPFIYFLWLIYPYHRKFSVTGISGYCGHTASQLGTA